MPPLARAGPGERRVRMERIMVFGEVGETIELLVVFVMMIVGILIIMWIQRSTSR
jgi:hypothetical protein